jgi:hypothetical protein
LLSDIITFNGFFRSESDILKPRWLLTTLTYAMRLHIDVQVTFVQMIWRTWAEHSREPATCRFAYDLDGVFDRLVVGHSDPQALPVGQFERGDIQRQAESMCA